MKKNNLITILFITTLIFAYPKTLFANPEIDGDTLADLNIPQTDSNIIFDDKRLLDGYTKKYSDLSRDILLEMMKDDTLSAYKSSASIRVFKQNFADETIAREKGYILKILLRKLNRTDSPFVEVEVLHTLCVVDRYQFFDSMVPALVQKLDHYNATVNEMAFDSINTIIEAGNNRSREARIIFNTLRKTFFLTRKRLSKVTDPDTKLAQKLKLLRWSIKVLGSQEINKLPPEVLNLL